MFTISVGAECDPWTYGHPRVICRGLIDEHVVRFSVSLMYTSPPTLLEAWYQGSGLKMYQMYF